MADKRARRIMNADQARPAAGKRGQSCPDRLLPRCAAGNNPQTVISHPLCAKRTPNAGKIIGRADDDDLHHRRMAGKGINTVTQHRFATQREKLLRHCLLHAAAGTGGNNHGGDRWRCM